MSDIEVINTMTKGFTSNITPVLPLRKSQPLQTLTAVLYSQITLRLLASVFP